MKKILLYLFVVAVVLTGSVAQGFDHMVYKEPWACRCIGPSELGEWAHDPGGCSQPGGLSGQTTRNNLKGTEPCLYINCRLASVEGHRNPQGEEIYDKKTGWKCVPRATY
ncbi:MAG: hypothetical protein M0009_14270 [Deltaproteobacteria bacterium]|nr:hypothetical protein [Deltaproteobacteria bacterium]